MKPMFKYSGGKSRELKNIIPMLPPMNKIDRVVEPFVGGGALSFHLEKPCVLTDTRQNVVNFYKVMQNEYFFNEVLKTVSYWKTLSIEERNKLYYYYRDDLYLTDSELTKALRWLFIRQQTFSGMDRINQKTGKINSPFGWYKNFNCNITEDHFQFMQKCLILNQSFKETLKICKENDFIFLDPPYLNRNSDYGNLNDNKSHILHEELKNCLFNTKSKWLLIHTDCEFYRDNYKQFNIKSFEFKYSQNFKGRDNSKNNVNHIYIKNF